jgi:glucosamine 6-phosphate synthetase-like amidotransferase/phosphosugar isomerase protein
LNVFEACADCNIEFSRRTPRVSPIQGALPDMASTVTPLVYAIPVQLIAYHTAAAIGTDVDQPRNLAKSVTVE